MGQKVHPIGIRLGNTQRADSFWYKAKQYYSYFIQEDRRIRECIFRIGSSTDTSGKLPGGFEPPIISKIILRRNVHELQIQITGSRLDFWILNRENVRHLRTRLVNEIRICRKDFFFATTANHITNPHDDVVLSRISSEEPRARTSIPRSAVKDSPHYVSFARLQKQKSLKHVEHGEPLIFIREMKHPERSALYQASLIVEELQKRTPFRRAIRFRIAEVSKIREIQGIRIQISGRLGGAEIARTQWTREGQVPLHTICANLDYSSRTAATIYGSLGVKVWIFTKQ
jgi:ribosomal protein S3